MAAASVGFRANVDKDVWQQPSQRNGLATVLRRGTTVGEVSLVHAAAIPGSRVIAITDGNTPAVPAVRGWDTADAAIAEADAMLSAAARDHEASRQALELADQLVNSQLALDARMADLAQQREIAELASACSRSGRKQPTVRSPEGFLIRSIETALLMGPRTTTSPSEWWGPTQRP